MNNMIYYIAITTGLCIAIVSCNASAYSAYFNQSPIGWHWNDKLRKPVFAKKKTEKTQINNQNNPIAQMHQVHKLLAYYKDKAVLDPTVENIKDYLVIQNMMMNQSSLFSENWKKTMLLYPQFDYGISHPTDSAITQIAQSDLHSKQVLIVKNMAENYGLLFFYNGNNPLSYQMEKTVSVFSKFYNFSTIAVSVDHTVIPGLLNTKINHGQAEALGVKALPALVLVNPKTGAHFILSYGYASVNELLTDCYNVSQGFIS
ncbi:MAG: conjugal transfer protein TraF [Gammaproteobacteria bacterium]|nr:conjugal transfer protein TraF [Gammaproteobacteria bacterium]